jgi:hypothetical protein
VVLSLFGCDDTAKWFAKPLNPLNNNPGYTYSSLGDARVDRAITANDLVDANGACPNYAPPSASPGAGEGASPQDGAALFGGGVALGMRVRHRRSIGTSDCRELRNRRVWIAQPRADL